MRARHPFHLAVFIIAAFASNARAAEGDLGSCDGDHCVDGQCWLPFAACDPAAGGNSRHSTPSTVLIKGASPGGTKAGKSPLPLSVIVTPPFRMEGADAINSLKQTVKQRIAPGATGGAGRPVPCPAGTCSPVRPTPSAPGYRDPTGRSYTSPTTAARTTDPISVETGEFEHERSDLRLPGRGVSFDHVRHYRSGIDYDGPLGAQWDHSYNQRVIELPDCSDVVWRDGRGGAVPFKRTSGSFVSSTYSGPAGLGLELTRSLFGWTLTTREGIRSSFNISGVLTSQKDSNGFGLEFTWEADPFHNGDVRLSQAVDSEGRTVRYQYTGDLLESVTEVQTGVGAHYDYDVERRELRLARNADGLVESYKYSVPRASLGEENIAEPDIAARCEQYCAPAGSRCGAGNGCADPTGPSDKLNAWCGEQKTTCLSACRGTCKDSCFTECVNRCPANCPIECANKANFDNQCEDEANRTCNNLCDAAELGRACGVCYYTDDDFGIQRDNGCYNNCVSCQKDGLFCDPDSCTITSFGPTGQPQGVRCFDDCKSVYLDGHAKSRCGDPSGPRCRDLASVACAQQCNSPNHCLDVCEPERGRRTTEHPDPPPPTQCANTCADQCGSAPELCGLFSSDCRAAASACAATCPAACAATIRARGTFYGSYNQLSHNLTQVYRGDFNNGGILSIENTYGDRIELPSFDKVTRQTNGDRTVGVTYDYLPDSDAFHPPDGWEPISFCLFPPNASETTPPGDTIGLSEPPKFRVVLTDAYGARWRYWVSARHLLLAEDNLDVGSTRRFEYDGAGRQVGVLEPLGERSCLRFGPRDVVTQRFVIPRPDTHIDVPDKTSTPSHFRYSFAYRTFSDNTVRLERAYDPRDPDRVFRSFEYDDKGNVKAVTDALGNRTSFVLDGAGRVLSETHPDRTKTSYTYESGVVSSVILNAAATSFGSGFDLPSPLDLAKQVTTTLKPDSLGRPLHGVGPFGEVTDWTWSGGRLDHLTRTNDGKVETISFGYTAVGDVGSEANGERRSEYVYDAAGLLRRTNVFALRGRTLPDAGPLIGGVGSNGAVAVSCTVQGPDGRLLARILPEGTRVAYGYDGAGHATTTTAGSIAADGVADLGCPQYAGQNPVDGQIGIITPLPDGAPASVKDSMGRTQTVVEYDGIGRPMIVSDDSAGTQTRIGYDALGNVLWQATYDSAHLPTSYRRPTAAGGVVEEGLLAASEFHYDNAGRLDERRVWHFDDRRLQVGDGFATTTWVYDDTSGRRLIRDDDGRTTTLEYDGAGRTTQITYPTNDVETHSYSDGGRTILKTTTAPTVSGKVIESTRLTTWGAPASVKVAGSQTPAPPRSFLDQIVALFARLLGRPVGSSNSGSLDLGGAISLAQTPPQRTWSYDEHKRLTSTTEAGGATTIFTYDALDRIDTETHAISGGVGDEQISYQWDRNGALLSRTSTVGGQRSATTSYTYDALGRVLHLGRPEGLATDTTYYGVTPLVDTITDARGVAFKHVYDPAARLQTLTASVTSSSSTLDSFGWRDMVGASGLVPAAPVKRLISQERSFSYDPLGRMLTAQGDTAPNILPRDHVTTHFAWDSMNNRVGEWNDLLGQGRGVVHLYDAQGRIGASTIARTGLSRQRDGLGRLTELSVQGQSAAHFDYNGIGGPARRTFRPSGLDTQFSYDVLGRLDGLVDKAPAFPEPVAGIRWSMGVDGAPRIETRTRMSQPPRSSVFTVDSAGRLLSENHAVVGAESVTIAPSATAASANAAVAAFARGPLPTWNAYTLDGRSNWTAVQVPSRTDIATTLNTVDQYEHFDQRQLHYDKAGALTLVDAAEVPCGGGVEGTCPVAQEGYSYDLFGNLLSATRDGVTAQFESDALDRLVLSGERGTPREEAVLYGWDGMRRPIRRLPSGEFEVTVDGDGLDEHLVRVSGDQRLFYHQDRQSSVYMMTDSNGRPVEFYTYTAYGRQAIQGADGVSVRQASAIGNDRGYQGQLQHPLTRGLVYMRARWHHPELGRFLSPDPIGLLGGPNLFAFVESAPLKWRDPLGLSPQQTRQSDAIRDRYLNVFQRGNETRNGALTGTQELYLAPPGADDVSQVRSLTVPRRSGSQITGVRIEDGRVTVVTEGGPQGDIGSFVRTAETEGANPTLSPFDFVNVAKGGTLLMNGLRGLAGGGGRLVTTLSQLRALRSFGLDETARRAFLSGEAVAFESTTAGGPIAVMQLAGNRLSASIFQIRAVGQGVQAFSQFRGAAAALGRAFGATELELGGLAFTNPALRATLERAGFEATTIAVPEALGGGTVEGVFRVFPLGR